MFQYISVIEKGLVPCFEALCFRKKGFYKPESFFDCNMVNFYKCKKCETKFIAPVKIEAEKGRTIYVCPKCQSRNWGPLDW